MKKLFLVPILALTCFTLVGCSDNANNDDDVLEQDVAVNVEGELYDLMDKLYENWKPEEFYMLESNYLSEDNIAYFVGTDEYAFDEAYATEPMMGSQAHSVVLIRVADGVDVDAFVSAIETNVDPYKWICVGVEDENVIVDSIGNLIVLIMDNDFSDDIHTNFKNLAE